MPDSRILELDATTDDNIWLVGANPGTNKRINLNLALINFYNTNIVPVFDDFVELNGDQTITGNITIDGSLTSDTFIKDGGTSDQILMADGNVYDVNDLKPKGDAGYLQNKGNDGLLQATPMKWDQGSSGSWNWHRFIIDSPEVDTKTNGFMRWEYLNAGGFSIVLAGGGSNTFEVSDSHLPTRNVWFSATSTVVNSYVDHMLRTGVLNTFNTDLILKRVGVIKATFGDTLTTINQDLSVLGNVIADSFAVDGGLSTQFLMADGSLNSSDYLTSSTVDYSMLSNNPVNNTLSTGVLTGCRLVVSGTVGKFNVTAGIIYHVDMTDPENPVITKRAISAKTDLTPSYIGSNPVSYIGVDKNDNIVQYSTLPTASQRRDVAFLGVVVHSDGVNVNAVNNEPSVVINAVSQIHDLMDAIGVFNVSGNVISANGANLRINKSTGMIFKSGVNFHTNPNNPHEITLGALTAPANMRYRLSNATEYANTDLIDPNNYESPLGTRTAVPVNKWTVQRLYLFPSNLIRLMYGQTLYNSLSEALDFVGKSSFTIESNIKENGLLIGLIVVKQNATALNDSAQAYFLSPGRFGEISGAGSSAVGTLQTGYDNGIDPEILTNAIRGAFSVRNGAGADTLNIIEGLNSAGSITFRLTGSGIGYFSGLYNVGSALLSDLGITDAYTKTEIDLAANNFFLKTGGVISGGVDIQAGLQVDYIVVDNGGLSILNGGIVASSDIKGNAFRATGNINTAGLTGNGVEIVYNSSGGYGRVLSYDRTSGAVAYRPLRLEGSELQFVSGGISKGVLGSNSLDLSIDVLSDGKDLYLYQAGNTSNWRTTRIRAGGAVDTSDDPMFYTAHTLEIGLGSSFGIPIIKGRKEVSNIQNRAVAFQTWHGSGAEWRYITIADNAFGSSTGTVVFSDPINVVGLATVDSLIVDNGNITVHGQAYFGTNTSNKVRVNSDATSSLVELQGTSAGQIRTLSTGVLKLQTNGANDRLTIDSAGIISHYGSSYFIVDSNNIIIDTISGGVSPIIRFRQASVEKGYVDYRASTGRMRLQGVTGVNVELGSNNATQLLLTPSLFQSQVDADIIGNLTADNLILDDEYLEMRGSNSSSYLKYWDANRILFISNNGKLDTSGTPTWAFEDSNYSIPYIEMNSTYTGGAGVSVATEFNFRYADGAGGGDLLSLSVGTPSKVWTPLDIDGDLFVDGGLEVAGADYTLSNTNTISGTSTTQSIDLGTDASYGSFLVTATLHGSNCSICKTAMVQCADGNTIASVAQIGSVDYNLGTVTIRTYNNLTAGSYSISNGRKFDIIFDATGVSGTSTWTYSIKRFK